MLTRAQLEEIRSECHADDVEYDFRAMRSWSEECNRSDLACMRMHAGKKRGAVGWMASWLYLVAEGVREGVSEKVSVHVCVCVHVAYIDLSLVRMVPA